MLHNKVGLLLFSKNVPYFLKHKLYRLFPDWTELLRNPRINRVSPEPPSQPSGPPMNRISREGFKDTVAEFLERKILDLLCLMLPKSHRATFTSPVPLAVTQFQLVN